MTDRQELQRRLEQARRLVREQCFDPLTAERLAQLIRDLEERLK
jgi:hypothetical protein